MSIRTDVRRVVKARTKKKKFPSFFFFPKKRKFPVSRGPLSLPSLPTTANGPEGRQTNAIVVTYLSDSWTR